MSCRFDKTSFLKNGADEVGQERADLDQNKQKGYIIRMVYPFFSCYACTYLRKTGKGFRRCNQTS